jgi:hypothetical protein
VAVSKSSRKQSAPRQKRQSRSAITALPMPGGAGLLCSMVALGGLLWWFNSRYAMTFQSPVRVHMQWPIVVSERITSAGAEEARTDQQGHRLTAWQQYACRKFGADCRVALAIQRAENPQGKCEIYHYNSDGTLDWGYFQINTVHLQRPGLNLRDLLDCKANIDFAFQLYQEQRGFTAWTTFNSGKFRKYLGTW